MKNLAFVFCFMLALLTFDKSSSAYGQCPDGTWTDGGYFITTIDGCEVYIYYCYRVEMSGSIILHYDYHVYKVLVEDACSQTIADWPDLYSKAGLKAVLVNPQGFPCPECPEYSFKYRSWSSECLKIISGEEESVPLSETLTSIDYIQSSDCGDLNMCVQGYAVCCDPLTGAPTVVANGSPVIIEGEDECEAELPITGNVNTNVCYKMIYCEEE